MPHEILIDATHKLLHLSTLPAWENELISKAPPVLWFGNSNSEKEKVLTMAANPSRLEFLIRNFNNGNYEDFYLESPRFLHLNDNQHYQDLVDDEELRKEIITSYDDYFKKNPYSGWFGRSDKGGSKAESLLRGLDASYYNDNFSYQACHIDLFPFATISNFKNISDIVYESLFQNEWGQEVICRILNYFKPKVIIVHGRTNFEFFCKIMNLGDVNWKNWCSPDKDRGCDIAMISYRSYQIFGISINLGNPKGSGGGFTSNHINQLGRYIQNIINP